MNTQKRVLLLVGSPRRPKSTSESLGMYLLDRLNEKGLITEKISIHTSLKSDRGLDNLLSTVDRSDIIILAFPLYVDSLPAPVIKAMELISEHRKTTQETRKQQLLAISNSGFPEASQNATALNICRCFALKLGFEWIGGLALGGGAAIDGRLLKDLGGMVRNIAKSLDITAVALAEGKPIPQEAVDKMAKPIIPTWLYMFFGGVGWKRKAKRYGAKKILRNQPYKNENKI